jgi:hypothetical protein
MTKLAPLYILFIFTSINLYGQNVAFLEYQDKEILSENKIKKITEYKIGLDKNGDSRWKRVESIKFYNQNGLIVMGIFPKYTMVVPQKKGGMTIDELSNIQLFETNLPTGEIDTIFYTYDQRENLTLIKDRYNKTINKYDSNNNIIEKCFYSEILETVCHFHKYKYNSQKKIISKIDSFGVSSYNKGYRQPNIYSTFKYDKNFNIIFDGKYSKIYNMKNQLISISIGDGSKFKISYFYDDLGRINQLNGDENYQTNTYFFYNDQNLVQEKKTLDKNGKLKKLFKYEYKSF